MAIPASRPSASRRSASSRRSPSLLWPRQGRSVAVLLVLLLLWSLCLGGGLAQAIQPHAFSATSTDSNSLAQAAPPSNTNQPPAIGTVDVVPDRYQPGMQLYLQTCGSCHIPIPPEVMPSETWRQLIRDPQHYGATLQPLTGPDLLVMWNYLRLFSRPPAKDEQVPYRIYQSALFKVLHPRVKMATRPTLATCISCHPGAEKYDFRSLTSEWQNAP